MIARQMQPGLERIFHNFSIHAKPLPQTPSSMSPGGTTQASSSHPKTPSPSSSSPQVPLSPTDTEDTMRLALENAVFTAIDLFQRVDQSQLHLLATTTDVTGSTVEKLIERYVSEHLHDLYVFPRLCALKKPDDDLLERKTAEMEYIDISQVGIPIPDQQAKAAIVKRIQKGMETLSKISDAKSPSAMMDVLLETVHALTMNEEDEALEPGRYVSSPTTSSIGEEKATAHDEEAANNLLLTMNADMLVSLLLVVVIRSRLRGLQSCLTYMRKFIFMEDVEQGERGYALSTLEAVLFHISLDSEQMGKASKRNGELWRRVRRGNLNGVKSLLEKRDGEEDVIDDAVDEIAAIDGKGRRSSSQPEVMFEDWVHKVIDDGGPMPRRVSLTGERPPPNVVASPAEEEQKEMLEPIHKTSKVPIHELVPELDLDPVDPDLVTKPRTEEEPPLLDEDFARREQESVVTEDEETTNGEGDDPAERSARTGNESTLDVDGDNVLGKREEGNSSVEQNGKALEPSSLSLENDGSLKRLELPHFPLEINLQPASPGLQDETTTSEPERATEGVLKTRLGGKGSRSGLKTKFNPEVEYDDSPRSSGVKLSRTLSMQSNHSHLSFASASSFTSLSRSQALSEDLTSIEKLSKTRNAHGDSVVMMAVTEGQKEVLEYLINESTYYPLNWLLEDENEEGTTLLSAAVQGQDLEIVEVLLNVLLQAPETEVRSYLERSDWMLRTMAHYLFKYVLIERGDYVGVILRMSTNFK